MAYQEIFPIYCLKIFLMKINNLFSMIYWMDILIGIELNSKTQKQFHKDLLNYFTLDKNPLMHCPICFHSQNGNGSSPSTVGYSHQMYKKNYCT